MTQGPEIRDRLAAALGSAVVMAVTLVLLTTATVFALMVTSFVHLVDEHGAQQFVGSARLALFFDTFLIGAACAFVSLAAVGGFVLGLLFPLDEMRGAMQEGSEAHAMPGGLRFMIEHMWLMFIGMMAVGVLWNLSSLAMPFFTTMWKVMTAFTILMGLAFAALFAWIIKRLVSPQIRAEFGR